MTKTMTVAQAKFLADEVEKLFERAAQAWVRGNNSGNSTLLRRGEARCDSLRMQAEKLLSPLGIKTDYPGLYPSFKVNGFTEHSALNAISAALAGKGKVSA